MKQKGRKKGTLVKIFNNSFFCPLVNKVARETRIWLIFKMRIVWCFLTLLVCWALNWGEMKNCLMCARSLARSYTNIVKLFANGASNLRGKRVICTWSPTKENPFANCVNLNAKWTSHVKLKCSSGLDHELIQVKIMTRFHLACHQIY